MGFSLTQTLGIGGDVGKAVDVIQNTVTTVAETVGQVTVSVVAAPVIIGAAIAGGQDPTKPAIKVLNSVTDSVSAVAAAAVYPYFYAAQVAQQFGGPTGGAIARAAFAGKVLEILIAPAVFETLLGKEAIAIKNPGDIVKVPLYAALAVNIESAAGLLRGGSQSIPFSVYLALKNHFPAEVFERARFIVAAVGINIAETTNGVQGFLGNQQFAVTVDDVIAFSVQPDESKQSLHWWAHELAHIQQYMEMGVIGFSKSYVDDLGKTLEDAAEAKASAAIPL